MKSFHVFLIVLLAVSVIAFAFQGSCMFTPYSLTNSKLNMSNYEGFSSKYHTNDLGYKGYDLGSGVPSQNSADIESAYGRVAGMKGLYGSPDVGERKDFIYGTAGSLDGPSYGYSNSMGPLQLSPEQIALLRSRGGNATGVDAQYGK